MKLLNNTKQRGFTLIELLVVIAIIGILSAVVLASLNIARSKGNDAVVKQSLSNARAQAELFYANYDSYINTGAGGVQDSPNECTLPSSPSFPLFVGTLFDPGASGNINGFLKSAVNNRGGQPATRVYCAVSASAWAFAAPLHNPVAGTTGWCVDSSGNSKAVNIDFSTTGTPLGTGVNIVCP